MIEIKPFTAVSDRLAKIKVQPPILTIIKRNHLKNIFSRTPRNFVPKNSKFVPNTGLIEHIIIKDSHGIEFLLQIYFVPKKHVINYLFPS